MSEYIELGSITGFFGVQGWIKLFSLTRPVEGISNYSKFYLGDTKAQIDFVQIKKNGKNIVGKINNIDSRELAEQYIGKKLYIIDSELPKLNNEYYWKDLIGLSVNSSNGDFIGIVDYLLETGANDVLVIKSKVNEVLIPFIMDNFILSVDIENSKMIVNWDIDED